MTHKFLPLIVILLIILASALLLFYSAPKKEVFSENPKDWIKQNNEGATVDVGEATKNKGKYEFGSQVLVSEKELSSVFFKGVYEGTVFTLQYPEEGQKIRISQQMNPNDSIADFFAVLREEKGKKALYIFVDEDWKKQSKENINIVYGDLQDKELMAEKKFDFSNVKDGVYSNKIIEPPVGGGYERIFVGDITKEDIKNSEYNNGVYVVIT